MVGVRAFNGVNVTLGSPSRCWRDFWTSGLRAEEVSTRAVWLKLSLMVVRGSERALSILNRDFWVSMVFGMLRITYLNVEGTVDLVDAVEIDEVVEVLTTSRVGEDDAGGGSVGRTWGIPFALRA